LHWLIIICGFFLADDPQQERVGIPTLLNLFSITCIQNNMDDPLVSLFGTIFNIVEFENMCIESNKTHQWSTLVGSTIAWFLNRWAQAYVILPDDTRTQNVSPNFLAMAGPEESIGNKYIGVLFQKVALNLLRWNGDPKLAHRTCDLLHGMTTLKIKTSYVLNLDAWRAIFQAHVNGDQQLSEMSPEIQKRFIQGLLTLHSSTDPDLNFSYFREVVKPIQEKYKLIVSPGFHANSRSPLAIQLVLSQLEVSIGIVMSTTQKNSGYVWSFILEVLPLCAQFLKIYKQADVASLVLNLWVAVARCLLDRLPLDEKSKFFAQTANLLNEFRMAGYATKPSRKKKPNQDKEQYSNIKKVLLIAYEISEQEHPNAYGPAFHAVTVVIPALTKDMFQFPKLPGLFFRVVQSLCRRHAVVFPRLPEDMFKPILLTFAFILKQTTFEPSVIAAGIDSLLHIFSFNLKCQSEGKDVFGLGQKTFLMNNIVHQIIDFVLFGNEIFSPLVLESATDLFFACVCFDQACFNSYLSTLIQAQDPLLQDAIANSFNALLSNLQPQFTGPNKVQFRSNMKLFLATGKTIIKPPKPTPN